MTDAADSDATDLDEWAYIEHLETERAARQVLLSLSRTAHDHALAEMRRADAALSAAVVRAQRARSTLVRVGSSLARACQLVEMNRQDRGVATSHPDYL